MASKCGDTVVDTHPRLVGASGMSAGLTFPPMGWGHYMHRSRMFLPVPPCIIMAYAQ